MQAAVEKNNFTTFAQPLADCQRRAATLEFDAQVYGVVEDWARAQHLTFAEVLDQVVTLFAGQLTGAAYPSTNAAQALRILDLDLIDRYIDRSISRAPDDDCGKLHSSATPQTSASAPAPNPEQARTKEILDYYQALTGNRLKASDYTNVRAVFDLPDLVIQAGILHSLTYAKTRIGSFAYCVKAMDNFLDPTIDLEVVCNTLIDKLLVKRSTGQLVLPLAGEKLLIGEFNGGRS